MLELQMVNNVFLVILMHYDILLQCLVIQGFVFRNCNIFVKIQQFVVDLVVVQVFLEIQVAFKSLYVKSGVIVIYKSLTF